MLLDMHPLFLALDMLLDMHPGLFVQIGKLHEEDKVSDDLFALACAPDKRVRVYTACVIDGVRYHTLDREKNRNTQNSGIVTEGEHENTLIDFYGQLRSIIRLQYNSSGGVHRSVVLFRCDWFDLGGKKNSRVREDRHFKSINTGRFWYKNDAFILTTQATKVFYLPDTDLGGHWRVVQKFQHRHLWTVKESEVDKGPGGGSLSYQDDDTPEVPVLTREPTVETRSQRRREQMLVDAAVVERMRKRRKEVVDLQESDDEVDHTVHQYCDDDEDNRQFDDD
jgi:hypothetical protein